METGTESTFDEGEVEPGVASSVGRIDPSHRTSSCRSSIPPLFVEYAWPAALDLALGIEESMLGNLQFWR